MKITKKILLSVVTVSALGISAWGACASTVDMGTNKITGLGEPTTAQDAATKNYVDALEAKVARGGAEVTAPAGYGVIYKGGLAWLDKNVGATTVASSWNDTTDTTLGSLFQWGRKADGHESRTSTTTTVNTQCSTSDDPGHADFILTSVEPYNWRTTDANCTGDARRTHFWSSMGALQQGVCPTGWRVPSEQEFRELDIVSVEDAYDKIKLSAAGNRRGSDGSILHLGSNGYYWASTVDGDRSRYMNIYSGNTNFYSHYRANGFSVRCVKHLD